MARRKRNQRKTHPQKTGGDSQMNLDASPPAPSSQSDPSPTHPSIHEDAILVPIEHAAKLLSMSRSTLDRLKDEIPGRRKIGGKVMYYLPAIHRWLDHS